MDSMDELLKDFTEITCDLCERVCGRKDCEKHQAGCLERNRDTVAKLILKGWHKHA